MDRSEIQQLLKDLEFGDQKQSLLALGKLSELIRFQNNEVKRILLKVAGIHGHPARAMTIVHLAWYADEAIIYRLFDFIEEPEVRWSVIQTLGLIIRRLDDFSDMNVVDQIVDALFDDDKHIQNRAFDAAVKMGHLSVGNLQEKLKSSNIVVRRLAAEILGHIGLPAKQSTSDLLRCLSDEDERVREEAAYSLGYMEEKLAIPSLLNALNDESKSVQDAAQKSLEMLGYYSDNTSS